MRATSWIIALPMPDRPCSAERRTYDVDAVPDLPLAPERTISVEYVERGNGLLAHVCEE
jgi:hypothetical protein